MTNPTVEKIRGELSAENAALRAELAALKQNTIKDVIKLPISQDLFRVRHEGTGPTERPDNVHLVNQPKHQTEASKAALEYAAAQALGQA